MMFVDFELQCRNFREDDIGKTGIDQRFDTCARAIGQQQLDQFVAHTFGEGRSVYVGARLGRDGIRVEPAGNS